MPAYDYFCEKCGTFEYKQGMNDPVLEKCPQCGGGVQRKFSTNVNFLFKGSGFYITDYRSGEYKKQAEAEKKAGEAGDAKPAAAPAKAVAEPLPGPAVPPASKPEAGPAAAPAPKPPPAPPPLDK